MATVYRILEHKDDPSQERTLSLSIGGNLPTTLGREMASAKGISELYRGTAKPAALIPKPYNFEPGTLFACKILVWFEGDWWLTDNPEAEFGRPSHYIELPELPIPQMEEGSKTMDSHSFCRMLLALARQDYKDELNRRVPKLSVTKSSIGGYEVAGPNRFYHNASSACCVRSAKAEAIDSLIAAEKESDL